MLWKIEILDKAEEDLLFFRKNDKNIYIKCFDIIQSILKDPKCGIGKPEKLKYLSDLYSRRITLEHRCVYKIDSLENVVTFISFKGHYTRVS